MQQNIHTLVDLLRWRAHHQPKQLAYAFVTEGAETARLTYEDLDHQSRVIGGFLQSFGETGSRVLLLYPPGLDYIGAFFGCLYAGAVAIPSYPPRLHRPDARLQGIVNDSTARIALTLPTIQAGIERRIGHTPELAAVRWEDSNQIDQTWAEKWTPPKISCDTLAFSQYTSGSTSTPKGVMVTHGNILYNQRMIQQGFGHTAESIVAGWLPIYHDMGLIGNVLQPLYLGAPCYLMAPTEFLQTPYNWLKLISTTQAHTSGGPNFAYDLCVQKITPEQRQTLDLSHWQVAFNGSEPVRAQTLKRFTETFASCGFQSEAFYPCYGLAETTLFVSGRQRGHAQIRVLSVQADALAQNQIEAAPAEDARACKLVSNGCSWLDEEILIVNPETLTRCAPNQVGEIWLRGPHVAQGYWQRPEVNQAIFDARLADTGDGPYLRTGDLGFLEDSELFVTGRIKDLLIIRGRNYYPQDIELTAEHSHHILSQGSSAAFSIEVDGEERLVIVHEVERHAHVEEIDAAFVAIRRAVADQHELQIYAIVLIRFGTLPKTSSGKVQRRACRDKYLEDSLVVVSRHILETQTTETPNGASDLEPAVQLSPIEKKLADIWTEVLHIKRIGPNDDFYALGGDSLQSANMVALARVAGLYLTAQQVSEYRTLASMAAVVGTAPVITATQKLLTGPIPVTHTQRWFLDQTKINPRHWRVASLFEVPADMCPAWIEQVVQNLLEHHDVLRSRFVFDGMGWQAQMVPPDTSPQFICFDFSHLPTTQHKAAIEKAAQELQGSLDIFTGPLMRVALFQLGINRPGRLLIAVHHAVVDGNTILLLIQDFLLAYQQLSKGEAICLPAKTTPYQQVAEYWAVVAQSAETRGELDEWLSFPWQHTPIPVDFHQASGNTEASMRGVFTAFSRKETRALLQDVTRFYNVPVMDVLIWGLVEALAQWTDGEWAQIKVVDSGQAWKQEMGQFDLSRTVGLFASDALLMIKRPDNLPPAEGLRSIQEQIQRIPRRGLGYELLLRNCADPERRRQLESVFKGEFKLNYHGRVETPFAQAQGFRQARESIAPVFDQDNLREVLIYCDGVVIHESLNLHWLYSENFHQRTTIAQVANNFAQVLRDLIRTLPNETGIGDKP